MEQVSYIHVDSRNRDTALFPFSNTYTVFLNKPIMNVTRVDLVSAMVNNPTATYGYIWLDITELRTPSTYDARKLALSNVSTIATPNGSIVSTTSRTGTGTGSATYTGVASTTSGSGSGARFNVVVASGVYTSVILSTNGTGYAPGDTITIAGANLGGSTPANNITLTVSSVGGTTNPVQRSQTSSLTPATSFAVIPMDVATNAQRTFKETTDYAWSVTYPSRLDSIERLTVRWLDKDGAIVTFGTGGSTTYDPNMFVLRVYTQIVPMVPERPLSLPPPVREGLLEDKSKVYLGALATLIIGLMMIMLTRRRT
jgi:hypothetical protein